VPAGLAALTVLGAGQDLALAARRRKAGTPPAAARSEAGRPDAALFQEAKAAHATLKATPRRQSQRTEWEKVVLHYRRVPARYPQSGYCDDALLAVGDLYRQMAVRFNTSRYRDDAVAAYQSLVAEYPSSRRGEAALFAVVEMAREGRDQGAIAQAARAYLAAYPDSPRADDVKKTARQRARVQDAALPAPPPRPGLVQVFNLRFWSGESSTRVVLDVEKPVEIHHDRISDPDRLWIDLEGSRLHPNLVDRTFPVGDGLLNQIRLGQNRDSVVRVVLDFKDVKDHSIFYLANPVRLVIDVQGTPRPRMASAARAPSPTVTPAPRLVRPPEPLEPPDLPPEPKLAELPVKRVGDVTPREPVREAAASGRPEPVTLDAAPPRPRPSPSPSGRLTAWVRHPQNPTPSPSPSAPPAFVPVLPAIDVAGVRVPEREPDAPAAVPDPFKHRADTRPARRAPGAPEPPQVNRAGSYSLARQLGLGARRIVIDAGHGGHDPGTIGRAGLQEKDLVLDVARRVERLVRTELGAEVVMTRGTDVFVPLEERTAIANSKGADLFLSIHANSSRNPTARGVETYFLNFAQDPHAEAVAARENAISAATLKDLSNLVKAITQNSKIEESRDFAASVQDSMLDYLRPVSSQIQNRGVRTAPFYVLIGANMPSILAEIAFVSNPDDERLLKTDAHRERIAYGLFQGVREYLDSLNRVQGRQLTGPSRGSRVASKGNRR
jgi:N-acetylmuramoyl-L-alanine amidase